MFPLKLTDHIYINPDAVVLIDFTPNHECGEAFLTVIFANPELSHLYLRGIEAVEAFGNWEAAHAFHDRSATKLSGGGIE